MATTTKDIKINLPPLHTGRDGRGGQAEVEAGEKRFTVVVCGRRWGKTLYGLRKSLKGAISTPGGIFWWVGPNHPEILSSNAWGMLKFLVRQIPGTLVREGDRFVELPNGAQIWIKSADAPDSLRGPKLSGVVLDEAAQFSETVWFDILRPALMDLKGWALFIGTPRGHNWLWKLYEDAGKLDDWAAFTKTTYDNPYLDVAEVDSLRLTHTEESFAREILASFEVSRYLVFPEFSRNIHKWTGPVPQFISYHGGMDFGGQTISAHKSSGVTAGRTARDELIFLDEFEQSGPNIGERQLNWLEESTQMMRILAQGQGKKFHSIRFRGDKTQMWGIQLVQRMGYNIAPSIGGKDSIHQTIEMVHRRLAIRTDVEPNGPRLYYMSHLHFIPEAFERYRYPDPKPGEVLQSNNPLSVQDDTMAAIRYCVEGVDRAIIGDPAELYRNTLPMQRNTPVLPSPRFKLKKRKGVILHA